MEQQRVELQHVEQQRVEQQRVEQRGFTNLTWSRHKYQSGKVFVPYMYRCHYTGNGGGSLKFVFHAKNDGDDRSQQPARIQAQMEIGSKQQTSLSPSALVRIP